LSFDLVLNGNEVGGGSVRIHDPHLQEKILQMLGIDKSSMQHMIDMLSSGCPPHGGIALGLDRLMSKILKTSSIRDVIAFPKTFEGKDPLSGAPSPVSEADQKLYNVKSVFPVK
jgi:aspartyl-tRNA synthetase